MISGEFIKILGGPKAFAERFGYNKNTVGAWVSRGIPARQYLENKKMAKALRGAGFKR